MKPTPYRSVHDAWKQMLREIRSRGERVPGTADARSVGSAFGEEPRDYFEILGATISIENPRTDLCDRRHAP